MFGIRGRTSEKSTTAFIHVSRSHTKKREEKVDVFVLALFTNRAPCSPWEKAEIPSKIKECCMENQ